MNRKTAVLLIALALCAAVVCNAFRAERETAPPAESTPTETAPAEQPELRAVWLTYAEIGALAKGRDEAAFRAEAAAAVKKLTAFGINTVFFHARAFSDALYASDLFPRSQAIAGADYDPFAGFIEAASAADIAVHAWVNPLRVASSGTPADLPGDHPAARLWAETPDALIVRRGVWYNPASDKARQLLLDGVCELLDRYDVAGIHFDDYFYPGQDFDGDAAQFAAYRAAGGALSRADWRAANLTALVASVHEETRRRGKTFSVSPAGDIARCLAEGGADVRVWAEQGFVDLLIPQLYYGFENEKMPFADVCRAWEELSRDTGVPLVCGLAVYKCGARDKYAGSGENEWLENSDMLARQAAELRKSGQWRGISLFSYGWAFGEKMNDIAKSELKNLVLVI